MKLGLGIAKKVAGLSQRKQEKTEITSLTVPLAKSRVEMRSTPEALSADAEGAGRGRERQTATPASRDAFSFDL